MPYVTLNVNSANRIKVPDAEYLILKILSQHQEMHAPAIARASNDEISINSIYTLLKRMVKRGIVEKNDASVKVDDIVIKRVHYKVSAGVSF